jgi:hypothetical protein
METCYFLNFLHLEKWGCYHYVLSLFVSKKPCMDIKVCLKINSSYKVHLLGVIFLTTKLTIVAVHVNYLYTSVSNHSYFTVSRTGKTKHTYEGPSNKSVFFQKALNNTYIPFIHVISSRKCYWKCGSERTVAPFTHICVHHFSGSV